MFITISEAEMLFKYIFNKINTKKIPKKIKTKRHEKIKIAQLNTSFS